MRFLFGTEQTFGSARASPQPISRSQLTTSQAPGLRIALVSGDYIWGQVDTRQRAYLVQ